MPEITMRERLGRALSLHACGGVDRWNIPLAGYRESHLSVVDIILAELERPTEAMIAAGNKLTHCGCGCRNKTGYETFRAMIRAAMAGG